jgi:signal transduction histidine kinase
MQVSAIAGSSLIVEKAFYEDTSTQQTFDQVKRQTFTPFKNILNKGYSGSVYWVRVRLDASRLKADQLVGLKITPTYLDEIALFSDDSSEALQTVGDRYPSHNNAITALSYNFVSIYKPDRPYLWLRLKTTSTSLMSVEALHIDDLNNSNVNEFLLSGLLIGLLIAFGCLAAYYFAIKPELVSGLFLLKQLFSVVLALAYQGYLRLLINYAQQPFLVDYATSISLLVYTLLTLVFYYAFFIELELKKWVRQFFNGTIIGTILAMFLFIFGHVTPAMTLNATIVAITGLMLFLIPIFGIDWSKLEKTAINKFMFVAIQALSLLMLMYVTLPALGLLSVDSFLAFMVLLNVVVPSFIMLMLVRYRAIRFDKERAIDIAVQVSKTEYEKAQRERQEQFMAMLTHEIKTPLALIRFAVRTAIGKNYSSSRIDRAVDDINAVIERCQQVDKLEKGWQFIKAQHDMATLVRECIERVEESGRVVMAPVPHIVITTDEILFKVILSNLLENAIKYAAPDTRVDVQVIKQSDHALVRVLNVIGKAGVPDAQQVFTKYYRSELAHAKTGSGLGLYIVKSLTELLGGKVTYRAEDDLVIFEICLPL